MDLRALKKEIAKGEDSVRQFRQDVTNPDSLASEMAAFANSEGGTIFLGVADDGKAEGLTVDDVRRINQMISNAATQHVRSPITVHSRNIKVGKGRIVIVLDIPRGIDRPYFDRNGMIWVKSGANKRRIQSKEELRRIFQSVDQFHADELPTKAGVDKLDTIRFRDFLRDFYQRDFPESNEDRLRLLQNMNLATSEGTLNLAGVLLFAERPEWIKPQFVVKAIRYPGKDIHVSKYVDTEDIAGPLPRVFKDALGFIMRNLSKVQAGRGVNAPGLPEIPQSVFEELLVNALVHRDYLIDAPVRIFVFEDRVEIISPGHLPNSLTVEKIRAGNSVIRNPILVSFASKGLLPYRGLGSGIKRALEEWPGVEFRDDREGNLFLSVVPRQGTQKLPQGTQKTSKEPLQGTQKLPQGTQKTSKEPLQGTQKSPKRVLKTSREILDWMRADPHITLTELCEKAGVSIKAIKKRIQVLKVRGLLRRIGPDKGGNWEVLTPSESD